MDRHRDRGSLMGLLVLPVLAALVAPAAVAANLPGSPDGTVRAVSQALADGHPEVVWQALPASYQEDVTEITHAFAAKMDPEIWNGVFRVGRKAVGVLRDKKQYILDSALVNASGDKKADVEANWDTVVGLLDSVFASDLASLESLKTMDWEHYLATTGAAVMAKAATMSSTSAKEHEDFVAKLRASKVEVVSQDGDSAVLRMSTPGEEPEEASFTRVEGRWVPAEMAAKWDADMADARQKIAAITPEQMAQGKAQAMAMIGMVEGVVDQLAAAETKDEFEQAMKNALGPFMGMMGTGQQGAGDESGD